MISVNRVSTKTSILYGLSYARSGYNRGSFGLCGNSFDNLDPATIARIDENLRYDVEQVNHLSLPIGIRQTMKQGMKWTIYGQAMLEPMVYIYTKFENHNEEAQVNEVLERSSNAKNIQLATGLALGFERTIKDGWTVAFRPTLRMHLTNAAKHADFAEGDAKHVTMGVAVALGHSF